MRWLTRKVIGIIRRILRRDYFVQMKVEFLMPAKRFAGKNVVVIGGTGGIGLAIAKSFLAEGAQVLVCGRNASKLASIEKQAENGRMQVQQFDATEVESIAEQIRAASVTLGGIDICINSAGAAKDDEHYVTEQDYDHVMDINLKSLYFLTKSEADYFVGEGRKGKIVNITSRCYNRVLCDPYILSKWGADCVTRGFARMYCNKGVCINGIAPGPVLTDIAQKIRSMKESGNMYVDHAGSMRTTMPEEVASLALYLCSAAADQIVGQDIVIDGGIYN